MLMHIISTIMVAVGLGLILIGAIGLTLSWVCAKEEDTSDTGTREVIQNERKNQQP